MDKEKLKNPEYKRMYQVLRERLAKNIARSVLLLLLFNVMLSFLLTSGFSPAMLFNGSAIGYVISFVFTSLILIVVFTLAYGIVADFTNIVLGKKNSSGGIFCGFFEKSKRIFYSSVFFTLVVVFVAFVSAVLLFIFKEKIISCSSFFSEVFSNENLNQLDSEKIAKAFTLALFYTAIFFFVFVFCFLPFIFVWNAFLENKKIDLKNAIRKSLFVIRGRYFHYLGFVIFVCLKNFAVLFVAVFLNAVLSGKNNFISLLLGFYA
ncbi:MAG TPA: hypothetical protein DCW73_02410, partial [Treponema sp.]|nr:hypothetical protein [Treponema sp.]